MAIEIVQYQTYDPVSITWKVAGVARSLTGATLTGWIQRLSGEKKAITGTLTPDADQVTNKGVFSWTFSAADVSDSSPQIVQFRATFGGSAQAITFVESLIVKPSIESS